MFRHADIVCLCLVCSSQCCVLHDLQFVMDAIGDHTEEEYSRAGLYYM